VGDATEIAREGNQGNGARERGLGFSSNENQAEVDCDMVRCDCC
jgi:hypothetical protein